MRRKKNINTLCEPGEGIYHTCGWKSERRTHKVITDAILKQPFYYAQWYRCTNPSCKTTIFSEEKDKVINKNDTGSYWRNREELEGQTSFFNSL